jgi:hypothetical protein
VGIIGSVGLLLLRLVMGVAFMRRRPFFKPLPRFRSSGAEQP